MQLSGDRERLAKIHVLWDEVADFPAANCEDALLHLMQTLCRWLRADDAFWVGAVRLGGSDGAAADPQHGWRGRAVRHLRPSPEIESISRRAAREQDHDPGMTSCALAASAGGFRVHRMRDGFIDFAAFQSTAHYDAFYRARRLDDRLWTVFPVNADAESYIVLDRYRTRRRFSAAEAELAGSASRGVKWLHRNLLLSHGLLVADRPLSPGLRKLLGLLLTEKSKKEIAYALGLTTGTTHQYTLEIYRRFGVNSRAGLMALWLGRPPVSAEHAESERPPTDQ